MTFYRFGNHLWRYRVAGLMVILGLTFLLIFIFTHLLQQSSLVNVKMPVRSSSTAAALLDLLRTRTQSPPVVFLKTHRTGGSTVQNILFRMGERDSATFAFPRHSYHFNYPQRFHAKFVDELPEDSSHFDILASSLRFDLSQLQKVMTPADPIFITILRDPLRTFESIFAYHASSIPAFTLAKNAASNKTALSVFLDSPDTFWDPKIPQNGPAKNPLSFDLGLSNRIWNSSWPGDLALLEETFNLVMIAEHFDESLLLLGALLNLELEELAYVRLNGRTIKDVNPINGATKAKIKAWNHLDVLVYDYFKQIFWEKAKQYGTERLKREVKLLRESTEKIRKKCLVRSGVPPEELEDLVRPWQTDSLTILGYEVNRNLTKQEQGFCIRMVLPEHQYHAHLYYQQYGKDMKVG